ncbi:unnamed protein product [Mytilus edulis]|uniref:Uncharacterized protein n=1 Tax=Mytilus edulis TaxID=6550 RepID=A0A8S3UBS8_MYTED|nr:unnamed protein product [Mytilus edulis]
MKEESVGIKNCIKDTYDKTTSFINEKLRIWQVCEISQCLKSKVLTTRCIEEIKTTVTEDGSNTRLHSEDQRRAIDSHLTENGKVELTAKVNQTHVTEDKEIPPEVEIQTNNDSSPEPAVTETIEITGKKVNSIILELKATPGILHSVDSFKAAILRLVQVMQTAGGIDVDIEDTVTVNLKFESPLTEDQFAVVKCLFAKEWNSDNDTKQLLDECSSISDEYFSTADVDEIESLPELDIYSQKGNTNKLI